MPTTDDDDFLGPAGVSLRDLMLRASAPEGQPRAIAGLAELVGCTPEALYKIIRGGSRLTPQRVAGIVDASGGRVSKEDFIPYMFS